MGQTLTLTLQSHFKNVYIYFNPFNAESDVYRRQILTSKVDPRAERVKYLQRPIDDYL